LAGFNGNLFVVIASDVGGAAIQHQ
jgi:hypothetical protein